MGKAHETAKAVKKHAVRTPKEKRAAKHEKKQVPGSLPFMGHHHSSQ